MYHFITALKSEESLNELGWPWIAKNVKLLAMHATAPYRTLRDSVIPKTTASNGTIVARASCQRVSRGQPHASRVFK